MKGRAVQRACHALCVFVCTIRNVPTWQTYRDMLARAEETIDGHIDVYIGTEKLPITSREGNAYTFILLYR